MSAPTAPDQSLRGKCEEMSRAAVEADASLTLVRGWYDDPVWGSQEHWWTTRPDGTIHDPTSGQFPIGGIEQWYRPFAGVWACEQCGDEVADADAVQMGNFMTCSDRCAARLVGF